MNTILISEVETDFLVQGLGLQPYDNSGYYGKFGRQEFFLYSLDNIAQVDYRESRVILLGLAQVDGTRPGDILMAGNNGELLDKVFGILDEMEQRGIVVSLESSGEPGLLYLQKDGITELVGKWKHDNISYLALFLAGTLDSEIKAKVVTLVRKIVYSTQNENN